MTGSNYYTSQTKTSTNKRSFQLLHPLSSPTTEATIRKHCVTECNRRRKENKYERKRKGKESSGRRRKLTLEATESQKHSLRRGLRRRSKKKTLVVLLFTVPSWLLICVSGLPGVGGLSRKLKRQTSPKKSLPGVRARGSFREKPFRVQRHGGT